MACASGDLDWPGGRRYQVDAAVKRDGVSVLVRDQAQPAQVTAPRAGRVAARHAQEAVLVFEAAARLDHHVQEVVVGIKIRPHHALARDDDLLHVGDCLVGVEQRGIAFEDERVLLAIHGKLADHRVAYDDRAVDNRVEVFAAERVE